MGPADALASGTTPEQIDAAMGPAVEALEGSDSALISQIATATLKLASCQETRVGLLRSDYLSELVQGLQSQGGETELTASEILSELCKCRLYSIFGDDNLTEKMLRYASFVITRTQLSNAHGSQIICNATRALFHLSEQPDVDSLCALPNLPVLKTLLNQVDSEDTDTSKYASRALQNLSFCRSNKVRMAQSDTYLSSLLEVATETDEYDEEVCANAIGALRLLAVDHNAKSRLHKLKAEEQLMDPELFPESKSAFSVQRARHLCGVLCIMSTLKGSAVPANLPTLLRYVTLEDTETTRLVTLTLKQLTAYACADKEAKDVVFIGDNECRTLRLLLSSTDPDTRNAAVQSAMNVSSKPDALVRMASTGLLLAMLDAKNLAASEEKVRHSAASIALNASLSRPELISGKAEMDAVVKHMLHSSDDFVKKCGWQVLHNAVCSQPKGSAPLEAVVATFGGPAAILKMMTGVWCSVDTLPSEYMISLEVLRHVCSVHTVRSKMMKTTDVLEQLLTVAGVDGKAPMTAGVPLKAGEEGEPTPPAAIPVPVVCKQFAMSTIDEMTKPIGNVVDVAQEGWYGVVSNRALPWDLPNWCL